MTGDLDREDLIALLERLGSESDEEALAAARALHARVSEAEASWDDLLARLPGETQSDEEGDDDEEDLDEAQADAPPKSRSEAPKSKEQAARLIDRMLRELGLSKDTREELKGYKTDIAEGEFDERDRAYLQALHDRLKPKR